MKGLTELFVRAIGGSDGEGTAAADAAGGERPGSSQAEHGADVAEATAPSRLPYQPALDGLRGLAVAAVLFYHADLSWARGGFLGVDAFFVLSGYLITSLLLVEWRGTGTLNVRAFWVRRFRRLLPALFLMLAGVAVYAAAFAEPDELDQLRGDALATIAYVANWQYVFSDASYFEQFALPSPLLHTWSLAIEEQFYIVWPLLVLALLWLGRGSRRLLIVSTLALVAGSALLMAWLYEPGEDPSRIYYGTDTRAQSLLMGAVLAMALIWYDPVRTGGARLLLGLMALVSAGALGWLWATVPDDSGYLYQGGYLLLAAAVACVIAAVVQPRTSLLSKALSLEPLRRLGLISYGVYLWHWPVFVLLNEERTGWDGAALIFVRISVTLAIAIASYYLLEQPIRRGSFRWGRASWAIAPAAAVGLAVVLVLATRGGAPAFTTPARTESAGAAVARAAETSAVRVLLVGDSMARSMSPGLFGQEREDFVLQDLSVDGCGLLPADLGFGQRLIDPYGCAGVPDGWREELDQFAPDVVVLVLASVDSRTHFKNGRSVPAGSPEAEGDYRAALQEAIDLLSSEGAEILLLTAPYHAPFHLKAAHTDSLNAWGLAVAEANEDTVTVVDLNRYLAPNGEYTSTIAGLRVRAGDDVHLSPEGASFVARWLAPQIVAIARGQVDAGAGEQR